jgi:hypothetical protein
VSSAFLSSGRYGAGYLWMFNQSMPRNQGWVLEGEATACQRVYRSDNERLGRTLIRSAPSLLPLFVAAAKPLRRALIIAELGRTVDEDACEPRRSSGSQSSCCMRSMPSRETAGLPGKRRDCFQFRIFCLVTCLCLVCSRNEQTRDRGDVALRGGKTRSEASVSECAHKRSNYAQIC